MQVKDGIFSRNSLSAERGKTERIPKKRGDYEIKSVSNALDLLEAFTGEDAELGVTELGKRLHLHKNNVFRLLVTLELRGYIEQNRITENYRLGLKPLELGKAFQRHCGLTSHAKEILKRLVSVCNETASIGVFRGGKVIYIDVEETTKSVRVISRLGAVLPAYCTSIGKVLLAAKSRDEILSYLQESSLKSFTEKSVTDPEVLIHQFGQVRRQGYAIDNEEYEESVKCVAVPVRDYSRTVVAGLSITGPAHRLPDERITQELLPLILDAGVDLSKKLGYNVERD
ncbi:MAG: IclR family transcriptional regulator [Deltaproteobacteria bacterium]|nr:IclR family transcriptional regulator [Deltaproteobacteria bacterium]